MQTFAERVTTTYGALLQQCAPFVPSLAEIESAFQPLVSELLAMPYIRCVVYVTETYSEAPPVALHVMHMYREQSKTESQQ